MRDLTATTDRQDLVGLADAQLAAPARKMTRVMRGYWPGRVLFLDRPWLDLGRVELRRGGRSGGLSDAKFAHRTRGSGYCQYDEKFA